MKKPTQLPDKPSELIQATLDTIETIDSKYSCEVNWRKDRWHAYREIPDICDISIGGSLYHYYLGYPRESLIMTRNLLKNAVGQFDADKIIFIERILAKLSRPTVHAEKNIDVPWAINNQHLPKRGVLTWSYGLEDYALEHQRWDIASLLDRQKQIFMEHERSYDMSDDEFEGKEAA